MGMIKISWSGEKQQHFDGMTISLLTSIRLHFEVVSDNTARTVLMS